ncbi:TolB family protein [Terrabacter sp. 2RAF25]|uniref:TolB family protein n=1 Tax=Terrabacter sp. 2RAF25 TaxID=3232998 RepID=UPI003F946C6E
MATLLAACSSSPGSAGGTASPSSPGSPGSGTSSGVASSVTPSSPASATPSEPSTVPAGPALVPPTASVLINADGHLRLVHADGTEGRIAVPSIDAEGTHDEVVIGDWAPDGGRISFTRLNHTVQPVQASVWVANSDGSGARQVVSCAAPCQRAGLGAWSPKGDQLAYVVTDFDAARKVAVRTAVEVVTLASGKRRVVLETKDPLVDYAFPRWSPDGTRLVLQVLHVSLKTPAGSSDPVATPTVAIVDLGRPPTQTPRVLAPTLPGTYPDWSWKSDTILFATNDPDAVSTEDVDRDVWTVRPDGSGLHQVTRLPKPKLAIHPSWTADGTIAFLECVSRSICYLAYAKADGSVVQTPLKLRGFWPRVKPVA